MRAYNARSMANAARFIAIEGGEGAGKSRLIAALGERLAASGREVVLTREPGGTPLGEQIRSLVLCDVAVDDHLAELLLFEAARAHLVATVIAPALERGAIVLCDRFAASSVAYQGYGRGLAREVVERANAIATGGLAPDVTLLLDLPVDVGLARRVGEGAANHFDHETAAFHERVRAGFLELARESPDTWRIIDAAQPFEAVVEAAVEAVLGSTHEER
jgi:dTMP kinase